MPATSVTIIFSPYHVGLRDHRVGDGPNRIRGLNIIQTLESLNLKVHFNEIQPVDDFEGEIGRSFEILRRTSLAVSSAISQDSFPLVLSGNCMATAGIACGLLHSQKYKKEDLGFVYFDAHDDMDTPSTNMNGYFDAMGLSMLAGKSWHALTDTIPGYSPVQYGKFLFVGLRDQTDEQRQMVLESGVDVVWGDAKTRVDFPSEMAKKLDGKRLGNALVHLDLDVLDESVGKVNGYESPGGLSEEDLVQCLGIVPRKVMPTSLTVCSFNPNTGDGKDGDKIAGIAVKAVIAFVESLLDSGALLKTQSK
jgi:arginase